MRSKGVNDKPNLSRKIKKSISCKSGPSQSHSKFTMPSVTAGGHYLRDLFDLVAGIFGAYLEFVFRLFVRPPMKRLDDDVILITGSGSGIGREMCLYLGKSCPGTTLVCWDINQKGNEATVTSLRSMGVRAFGHTIDISEREQVAKYAMKIREEVGDVTVIINNAGFLHKIDSFLNLSPMEIEKTFTVNTMAHCWVLREFLPQMVERNSGHIVTISSLVGHFGYRNVSVYSASKFAVRGLIESIALEMKSLKLNIKFTTVFPGFTNTPMTATVKTCTSLPYPIPMLNPKEVAMEVIDSFRRNEEHVYIPRGTSRFLVFLINILLAKAGDALKSVVPCESKDK